MNFESTGTASKKDLENLLAEELTRRNLEKQLRQLVLPLSQLQEIQQFTNLY